MCHRSCAGRHFAEPSLFIAMASVLHAFVIEPPLDAQGHPKVLTNDDIHMVQSFVAYVRPFHCSRERRAELGVCLYSYPDPLNYRFLPRSRALQSIVHADITDTVANSL